MNEKHFSSSRASKTVWYMHYCLFCEFHLYLSRFCCSYTNMSVSHKMLTCSWRHWGQCHVCHIAHRLWHCFFWYCNINKATLCWYINCALWYFSLSEMSDEVQRVRPSRFLHPDGIVRPFVYHDAEGNQILQVHFNTLAHVCCSFFSESFEYSASHFFLLLSIMNL